MKCPECKTHMQKVVWGYGRAITEYPYWWCPSCGHEKKVDPETVEQVNEGP